MWKCPVCDRENTAATVCPQCGYDRTCDYEQYPTAFTVKGAKSTRALRREWQKKQNPPPKPQPRPAEAKPRPTAPPVAAPAPAPTPAAAPAPAAVPAKKKSGLWKVLLAVLILAAMVFGCSALRLDSSDGSPSSRAHIEYKYDNFNGRYGGYLIIQLGNGTLGEEEVATAKKLLAEHSCTKLRIVSGVVDADLLSQIARLTSLTEIDFSYCDKAEGFDQFSRMTVLASITLDHTSDIDLAGIEKIKPLRTLNITNCENVDLRQPMESSQLTTLKAIYSHIDSLSGLGNLKSLTTLYVYNNQVSDLQPLSGLSNLEYLYAFDNQITNLAGLENLKNLKTLYVAGNQISDLRPLSKLANLESLSISRNQITSLAGLENLTNLTDIDASGNPLTDTSALEVSGCMDALHMD